MALHALTAEEGVMPILAKGVHRPTSGALGVLDTWALVDMVYGGPEDASMLTLFQCRLLNRFSALSTHPDRLIAAGLVAEIAELAAPAGPPAKDAFHYLFRCFQSLSRTERPLLWLHRALWDGLVLLGLHPVLDPDEEESASGYRWFSPAHGGLLAAGSPRPPEAARRLSGPTLAYLRALAGDRELPPIPAARAQEILTILGEFLAYHLERPPRAWMLLLRRKRRRQPA